MPFSIERNDLAQMDVDAVVVAANENLRITGGVGYDVAMAAGFERVQRACDEIGYCPTGSAVTTPGFDLHAATIVHAVGPIWQGGDSREDEVLRAAYESALRCCVEAGARSAALPLISAGTYGFPAEISFRIAIEEVRSFLEESDIDVRLVLFNRSAVRAAMSSFGEIAEYIDDHYVDERATERYSRYERELGSIQLDGRDAAAMPVDGKLDLSLESTSLPDAIEVDESVSYDAVDAARSYEAPTPSYGAAPWPYGDSGPSYEAPGWPYDAPAASYGAPSPSYGVPDAPGAGAAPDSARAGKPAMPTESKRSEKTPGPLSRISQFIEELRERKSNTQESHDEAASERMASMPAPDWRREASAPAPSREHAPSTSSHEYAPSAPAPLQEPAPSTAAPAWEHAHYAPASNLSDWLDALDEPFSTTLLALIDDRGLTDVQVYKRANMSRQLFSKIRSDANYRPTKKTVLALAIALGLDLDETSDLLKRAGFALSNSNKADVIIEYFIVHDKHDIYAINEALYAFDQPTL